MEKTKRGFNIVDMAVVAIIITVIAAGIWYFTTATGGEQVDVYFTVELRERMPGFEENIIIGGEIRDSVRNILLGYVVDIYMRPATLITFDSINNVFLTAYIPDRYDVYITVRGSGTESDSEIRTNGELVRVGQEMFLRGRGFAGIGFITELWTEVR